MTMRIIPLLVVWIVLAGACGADGKGMARAEDVVRFDTAMGYRLGMLLPEARAVANARGEELECEIAWTGPPRADMPDSIYQYLKEVQNCNPGDVFYYRLHFYRGSLQEIDVGLPDDWDYIPVDTLVGRLTQRYGKRAGWDHYRYEDGRREQLIWWFRKGQPGALNVRCPEDSRAGDCELEYRL